MDEVECENTPNKPKAESLKPKAHTENFFREELPSKVLFHLQ
jgi:hypothetical protein